MPGPTPRVYKTSEIKSRLLNVARPSTYMVKFTPPPAVQSFIAQRGISYATKGETFELSCSVIKTPSTNFLTHAVSADYHGVNQEIPYRRAYENEIGLTFYVDAQYEIVEFFEGWVDYMSGLGSTLAREEYRKPQAFYRQNYYNDYASSSLFLTKFERSYNRQLGAVEKAEPQKYLEYEMIQAYPKAINSMELGYAQYDSLLTLDVTFGYTRYVRVRR
mgnify:FL=1